MNNDRFKFRIFSMKRRQYESDDFWMSPYGRLFIDDDYDCPSFINYPDDSIKEGDINIKDFIIEQCTGLKDANGTLVYEGDILTNKEQPGFVFVIEHNDEFTRFRSVAHMQTKPSSAFEYPFNGISKSFAERSVVVGNIHEDTKLLKHD